MSAMGQKPTLGRSIELVRFVRQADLMAVAARLNWSARWVSIRFQFNRAFSIVPQNFNGGLYVKSTGEPTSMSTSKPSVFEKWAGNPQYSSQW
jgi:hypothetical protein